MLARWPLGSYVSPETTFGSSHIAFAPLIGLVFAAHRPQRQRGGYRLEGGGGDGYADHFERPLLFARNMTLATTKV